MATTCTRLIVRMPVGRMRVAMAAAFVMWCLGAHWWPDRIVRAVTGWLAAWVSQKFHIEAEL